MPAYWAFMPIRRIVVSASQYRRISHADTLYQRVGHIRSMSIYLFICRRLVGWLGFVVVDIGRFWATVCETVRPMLSDH